MSSVSAAADVRPGGAVPSAVPSRRRYLDWIRGLAVLIMIQAHVFDAWTHPAARPTVAFRRALILGGYGAPLFLLLAGVAVALAAGSRSRRTGDRGAAARSVMWRGVEIFLLAFLFRVQAWILGQGPTWGLLRVDILNVMGPSIVGAAAVWGRFTTRRGQIAAFTAIALSFSLLTPFVRMWPVLAALPDPLEAYLRPVGSLTNFAVFPWAGFVFAGGAVGVLIDAARTPRAEARLNLWLGAGGVALALTAHALSFRPSLYSRSEYWTSSPSFYLLRLGVMVTGISLAYLWSRRPRAATVWSPLEQLGRTSLFIYWIHVELVYGLISMRLHGALTFAQTCVAFVLFSALMLLCSIAKDRFVSRIGAVRPAEVVHRLVSRREGQHSS